jgi:RNA-directed DNA polymerase
MNDNKRQTSLNKASPLPGEVKPRGSKEIADSFISRQNSERPVFPQKLMEEIVHVENVKKALERVESNQGSPGIDRMKTTDLRKYLRRHWLRIRSELLNGTYKPQPVKRVEIPKPDGSGMRKLGIPTVLDRFIQQSILQTLQPRWDKTFSEHSYGFRPGRSAHQAVSKAQRYLREGYGVVVDIDLEKFFDRVNHDRLMSRLADRIGDKRLLKLIRAFLNAGVMANGLVTPTEEGTPQGGPLSPLLSNIVLDELDRELECRGHRFVRYADDCNIYVRSEKAGQRVMESTRQFITRKLKLKVNEAKSAVAKPSERKFLGFSFTGGNKAPNRRKIAPQAVARFKTKVRVLTNRNRGKSLEKVVNELSSYLCGWGGYFGFCETPRVLQDFDCWIRRRLRCLIWRQWKVYRRRKLELIKRGINPDDAHTAAWSGCGPWKMSHVPPVRIALPNAYFDSLDLPRLAKKGRT